MKILKSLSYLWQLPQHLLAKIILHIHGKNISSHFNYGSADVFVLNNTSWGMSLGKNIIISRSLKDQPYVICHEYGHSLQSLKWGWLYLLVVGLPSLILNKLSFFLSGKGKPEMLANYFNYWPENEANKLGKVTRLGI